MTNRIVAELALTDNERNSIGLIIQSLVSPYRQGDYQAFISGCQLAATKLPWNVHKWSDSTKASYVGIIRNLPVDATLPSTPTTRNSADDRPMLTDGVIGAISALFGTVYTIEGKGTGRHIQNVYPILGDEYTQLGSSSMINLDWHVEEAFHHIRPTWLSLLCIRGDGEATTKVARARDLQLPASIRQVLEQFRFKLRVDETYSKQETDIFVTTSVLSGIITDPEIILDPAYTVFQTQSDRAAISAVESAAEEVQLQFALKSGDLLVFNNRRTIHSRNSYQPRMDGTDRWLKRAFIIGSSECSSIPTNGVVPFSI